MVSLENNLKILGIATMISVSLAFSISYWGVNVNDPHRMDKTINAMVIGALAPGLIIAIWAALHARSMYKDTSGNVGLAKYGEMALLLMAVSSLVAVAFGYFTNQALSETERNQIIATDVKYAAGASGVLVALVYFGVIFRHWWKMYNPATGGLNTFAHQKPNLGPGTLFGQVQGQPFGQVQGKKKPVIFDCTQKRGRVNRLRNKPNKTLYDYTTMYNLEDYIRNNCT